MFIHAKRFQASAAAVAIAASAALTPAVTAHALPAPQTPASTSPVTQTLGDSVLSSAGIWWLGNHSNSVVNATNGSVTTTATPNHGPLYPIVHNRLLWIGTPNPTPPGSTRKIIEVYPLNFLPGFMRPFFGWFEDLNFQACLAGVSVKVGPYGSVSASIGRGC